MEEIKGKVSALSSRIEEVEKRVVELEDSADASKRQIEIIQKEMQKLRDHVCDLVNRGRRCNVKILGIPELKDKNDMIQFRQREIPVMLERQFPSLDIQWAHRVPTGLPRQDQWDGDWLRPILVNFLRYQVKEDILRAARDKGQVLWQGSRIMFSPDYSKQTTERRVSFKQVKSELKNKGVEYSLHFPTILEIKLNGARHRFNSPEEASQFINKKIAKENWFNYINYGRK